MYKCLMLNLDDGGMIKRSLGVYRIAHFLRQNDWDAEVIEFSAYWTFEQLKQMFIQRVDDNLKFIGLSALFINSPIKVIDQFGIWVKQNYPHIKFIIGGPNKYRLETPYIDYNIHGFGENAILVLLKYLFSNGPSPVFTLHTNSGKNIAANDWYPAFPREDLAVIYEDRDFIQPHEWLGAEFSRGCIFQCAYCNFPVLGVKGDYTRSANDFELQMRNAYDRFGVTRYYTSDETFNDRTEKITKFADVVEKLDFQPFFTGFIRPDLLVSRPTEKEELLRMGYLGHFYGIESFYHRTGKAIGKGMDPDKLKQGLLDVRKYFETHGTKRFRATVSLIAGLPYEPISSLMTTKQWLWDNWQGQSFSIYPLEIPISEYDNPSKIGMNWTKYGYEDASEELKSYKITRATVQQDKQLIWKNSEMTVEEAEKVSIDVNQIKSKEGADFRIGNYSMLRLGLPHNIDEILALPDEGVPVPMDFISNYIEKKLNL